MQRATILIVLTVLLVLSCSEEDTALRCKRGQDGRELIYEADENVVTWPHDIALSPDASEIAFNIRYPEYDLDGILILDVEAAQTRFLLEEDAYWPKWSPSGEWIAFSTNMGPGPFYGVYLIRPDGTGLKPAVATENNETAEAWFSGEDKLVVFSVDFVNLKEDIGVYDADTDNYGTIKTFGPDYNNYAAAVSPYDDWIALTQTAMGGHEIPLAYMRSDGSDYHVEYRDPSNMYEVMDWSPDGQFILFTLLLRGDEYSDKELWIYDAKTGELEQLTMARVGYSIPNPPFNDITYETISSAEWGPDGYIYFAAGGNLYRIEAPEE